MIYLYLSERVLVQSEIQTALSRIWTCIADSIFYNVNHYTKRASFVPFSLLCIFCIFSLFDFLCAPPFIFGPFHLLSLTRITFVYPSLFNPKSNSSFLIAFFDFDMSSHIIHNIPSVLSANFYWTYFLLIYLHYSLLRTDKILSIQYNLIYTD